MNTTDQKEPVAAPRVQWIRPNCYFCQRHMIATSHKTIENKTTGHVYVKTKYMCPDCDYRQTNEVPRKLALTIVDEDCIPQPLQGSV